MGRIVDAFDRGGSDPAHQVDPENFKRPHAQEDRARFLAIIDSYLKKHGIDALIPEDRRPYELRTPEQQNAIRSQANAYEAAPEDDRGNAPAVAAPPAFYQYPQQQPAANAGRPAPVSDVSAPPSYLEPENFQQSALAASIAARRAGVTQEKPLYATPRTFFESQQAAKSEEMQRLHNFIYGQRRFGAQ